MILLRYNEIALKGGNRRYFESALAFNARELVKRELRPEGPLEVRRIQGRLVLQAPWNQPVRDALERVFGLANFSPAVEAETSIEAIGDRCLVELDRIFGGAPSDSWGLSESSERRRAENEGNKGGRPRTFRVTARRSEKALEETSVEINRQIGARIKERFPWLAVDLVQPELTVGVELRQKRSFLWIEKVRGPGGLPVGTNGHFLTLLSGGLDSPVAAIQALKRGANTSFIHFSGDPYIGNEGALKAQDLARRVARFQPRPKPFYKVSFGRIQMRMALEADPKVRTVLYRRMMIRISEALAERIGASALVTGESIGQVASQTISNLSIINLAARRLPILRPLITMDKAEIIDLARAWGTYDLSIAPGLDCCTLFADRHPSLHTTLEAIEAEEARLPIAELVAEGLAGTEKL